jgi:hypothetical protein
VDTSTKEREKIILHKYLELTVFDTVNRRSARLISYKGNFSEKRTWTEIGKILPITRDSNDSTSYIVGTSVRFISFRDNTLSGLAQLGLAHEEKVRHFSL